MSNYLSVTRDLDRFTRAFYVRSLCLFDGILSPLESENYLASLNFKVPVLRLLIALY
jgi:hypothetical protein